MPTAISLPIFKAKPITNIYALRMDSGRKLYAATDGMRADDSGAVKGHAADKNSNIFFEIRRSLRNFAEDLQK